MSSSVYGAVAPRRLIVGDSWLRLTDAASGEILSDAACDGPDAFAAALRVFATFPRAPTTAVLPQALFRSRVAGRLIGGFRSIARLAFAASLGIKPAEVALAAAALDCRGQARLVAADRRVLREAAEFCAAQGVPLTGIEVACGAGVLPGILFERPGEPPERPPEDRFRRARGRLPIVSLPHWSFPSVSVPRLSLRKLAVPRPTGRPAFPLLSGHGLGQALRGLATRARRRPLLPAALATAGAAAIAIGLAASGPGSDVPAAGVASAPPAAVPKPVPTPAAIAVLEQPPDPAVRAVPSLDLRFAVPPRRRPPLPPLPAVLIEEPATAAAVATRSVPPDVREAALAAAAPAGEAGEPVRSATLAPLARPAAPAEVPAAGADDALAVAEDPPPAAGTSPASASPAADAAGLRPLARALPRPPNAMPNPAAAVSPSVPETPAPASESSAAAAMPAPGRPVPRPMNDAERVERAVAEALAAAPPAIASLGTGTKAAASLAGAAVPRPAPRSLAQAQARQAQPVQVARAEPPRQAAPAATAVRAAPASQAAPPPQPPRTAPVAAQAQRQQAAPATQPQRTAPVAGQTQVARAQPARQPAPAPAAAAPAATGSANLALVGVFGTASQRHALVRLPNGSVQRVRPGETVAGVQIAAVGSDSVRIRSNGRDAVLRLPD